MRFFQIEIGILLPIDNRYRWRQRSIIISVGDHIVKVLLRCEIAQVGAVDPVDDLFLNFLYRLHDLVRVRVTALANIRLLRVHVVRVCVGLRNIADPIRPIILSCH